MLKYTNNRGGGKYYKISYNKIIGVKKVKGKGEKIYIFTLTFYLIRLLGGLVLWSY